MNYKFISFLFFVYLISFNNYRKKTSEQPSIMYDYIALIAEIQNNCCLPSMLQWHLCALYHYKYKWSWDLFEYHIALDEFDMSG